MHVWNGINKAWYCLSKNNTAFSNMTANTWDCSQNRDSTFARLDFDMIFSWTLFFNSDTSLAGNKLPCNVGLHSFVDLVQHLEIMIFRRIQIFFFFILVGKLFTKISHFVMVKLLMQILCPCLDSKLAAVPGRIYIAVSYKRRTRRRQILPIKALIFVIICCLLISTQKVLFFNNSAGFSLFFGQCKHSFPFRRFYSGGGGGGGGGGSHVVCDLPNTEVVWSLLVHNIQNPEWDLRFFAHVFFLQTPPPPKKKKKKGYGVFVAV